MLHWGKAQALGAEHSYSCSLAVALEMLELILEFSGGQFHRGPCWFSGRAWVRRWLGVRR